MADNVSYGIGQYRSSNNYNYIVLPGDYDETNEELKAQSHATTDKYQEIKFRLPHYRGQPFIQYGRAFYARLTVPQNPEYTSILNLKLCPQNSKKEIDTTRFQQIKRLVVPPTPEKDSYFSTIILYEVPRAEDNTIEVTTENRYQSTGDKIGSVKVQLWETDADKNPSQSGRIGLEIIDINDNRSENYYYYIDNKKIPIENKSIHTIIQDWKLNDNTNSTITFDFIFSPKYNLTEGYSYLLIELDRTDAVQQTIQYIENNETYYGTKLNPESITLELYAISNLLEGGSTGTSQIQSGSNSLTHIAVWGHPEQLLAINGEEIRIGQSGFYELDDFTINQLGVVVTNNNKDRFTIDYEYRINN